MTPPTPSQSPRDAIHDALKREGLPADWPATETIRPRLADLAGPAATPDPVSESHATSTFGDGSIELLGSIAKGGMGWVRLARQPALGRKVAVKGLLPDKDQQNAALALIREARTVGLLEHPNVVPVYDLVTNAEGSPLMVMKRIEGASWAELIADPEHPVWDSRDPAGPIDRHVLVLSEVCQALIYAHSQGVLHLDLKPANVMVGRYGETYVLDWGIARGPDLQTGAAQHLEGTPAYMPPELVDGRHPRTATTDVYLLGACLHQVLTGRPRHRGSDLQAVLEAAALSAPATFSADVPEELAAICNRACAAAPKHRYPSVRELRRALLDYLTHRNSVALASQATAELQQVTADIQEATRDQVAYQHINKRLQASRFRLDQALQEWPGNATARAQRRGCLEALVRWELSFDNHQGAAFHLADIEVPDEALVEAVEEAQEAAKRRARAQEELDTLRAEMAIPGRNWGRALVTLLNGLVTATVLLWIGSAVRAGDVVLTRENNLIGGLVGTLGYCVGIIPFRRVLLDNRAYGRLMIVLGVMCPMLVLNRLLAFVTEASFAQVLTGDGMVMVALAATLAAVFDRAFWVSTVIAIGTTVWAVSEADYALDVVAGGFMLNSLFLSWVVRPRDGGPVTTPA